MTAIQANGIMIEYDEFGAAGAPVILLIMGLGTQMIGWPEDFCAGLAARGFRVIRFDNRDIGLSSKIDQAGAADIQAAFLRLMSGQPVGAPYGLDDMALDAVALLDRLGVARAHIVGASMGGMIAQIVAAKHPEHTRGLVSIMSTSGNPRLPQGKPSATQALMAPRPMTTAREALIAHAVMVSRALASPGYPMSDAVIEAKMAAAIDRSYYPAGAGRQFLAVLASGSRVELLKTIKAPTLVIHGVDDPLIPVEAGKDTAAHIPRARLELIPGMGHDLPPALVPLLVDLIAEHCKAIELAR
jgi:pimeloyl-ACP methyl ester carboxylesterase